MSLMVEERKLAAGHGTERTHRIAVRSGARNAQASTGLYAVVAPVDVS